MNIWKTAVTDDVIQASREAVTLCVAMLCIMTLWTGVLKVGHRFELVDQLARRMGPILTLLFPRLDPDGKVKKQISVSVTTNVLGLRWTATPARFKAMEELKKVEEERREEGTTRQKDTPEQEDTTGQRAVARQTETISNEMCTFLIINMSSL